MLVTLARTALTLLILTGCVAAIGPVAAGEPLRISRITPAGNDVPRSHQIVFQFDRAVVPIGRMAREAAEIPATISPQLDCEWRWLNTSALACQLTDENAMNLATRYRVSMAPGFSAIDGSALDEEVTHAFETARPRVTYTRFVNWLSAGTPLIRVAFNQAVVKHTVEQALVFSTAGGDIPVIAYAEEIQRRAPRWSMVESAAHTASGIEESRPRRVWVIEPVAELALDATVALNIKPGVEAVDGPLRGAEQRTVVAFDTYPEFRFLGVRCTPKGSGQPENLRIEELSATGSDNARGCAPLKPVALLFSAPVLNSAITRSAAFVPALDGGREDFDPWQRFRDWSQLGAPHRQHRIYERRLPTVLQADRRYAVTLDAGQLTDEFGRTLPESVAFTLRTSHREPNLKLGTSNAVLEHGVDSDVPLYVTNLDNINVRYDRLTGASHVAGLTERLDVDDAEDIAYARPLEARRLIGETSGAIFARLQPNPTPPNWHRNPQLLAQVTPFQIHFKLGHFNSLAWVTDFANGEPVAGATVSLWAGSSDALPALESLDRSAITNSDGLAELPGLAALDPELERYYGQNNSRFFVRVEKEGHLALLPVTFDYAVRGGSVYPQLRRRGEHGHAWGTTAQGIYKLGDSIDYKIYVRDQSNRHWVRPGVSDYALTVTDPQGKTVHERTAVSINAFGAFDGSFRVPESGTVGWYRFTLRPIGTEDSGKSRLTWQPLSVLVSDFTPSPFKVSAELNGSDFGSGDRVTIATLANLHAGGPYTSGEVRVTARLERRTFSTDNPLAAGFTFGGGMARGRSSIAVVDKRGTLNDFGQYETAVDLPDSDIDYGTLLVETAVRDDRGKLVAANRNAAFAGRDLFVGLKQAQWLYAEGEPAKVEALVVDRRGRVVSNAPIAVVINRREIRAARVRGPGNAYLTRNIHRWVAQTACQLTTTDKVSYCDFTPSRAGYYQFIATTLDGRGREHQTVVYGWVTGAGNVVWEQTNDATLQLVAERADHAVGDTARFLVKNPFPGAKALVSVERYGVIDSWTVDLATHTPVIEVPIKADYLPGFYLSVVAVSPRVAAPLGTGKVDLGKPSYRMGYLAVRVSDPHKQLLIDVATNRATFKPRDRVRATVRVRPPPGAAREPVEIAVAVVDEAVLAMNRAGSGGYDPYRGFNRLDNLDVNNYSVMSRLIGRQKFEKKGANPGGGGGADAAPLRNRFKFLSYWNPSLLPADNGEVSIEFEVPDNLTGWRVLAMAVTPDDRMGLGETAFKVNRPTEIRPVMPNHLIENDRVKAGFTVMNRTAQTRTLTVSVDVTGPLAETTPPRATWRLTAAPYARIPITIPLATRGPGTLAFVARAGDVIDSDAVEHALPVRKRRSLETAANYGTTTAPGIEETFAIPDDIYTDAGSIEAVLSPSVIGHLDGAFEYLRTYPHLCWEQRLTKAVAASTWIELQAYLDDAVAWPTPLEDIARTLTAAANFQAPNGGMTYWVASNDHVSPYLSAYTAMAFNWLRRDGHAVPVNVEKNLRDYLLMLLRRDAFPSFYSPGMASSVRAVALAALAGQGAVSAQDVARYRRHVPAMDLFGKAHYLRATLQTTGVDSVIAQETLAAILARANQSGGKFHFNETADGDKYLHGTALRSNCAILSGIVEASGHSGIDGIGDIPFKLVRAITQSRGNRAHFENTQENVFCLNALVDYAKRYESARPNMQVSVALDGQSMGEARFTGLSDRAMTVGRDLDATDPGATKTLTIGKSGPGRLYYAARLAYDRKPDNTQRINAGIEIRREYAVERNGRLERLTDAMRLARGELVRVDLFVSVPGTRHFVVVDDPIPGGLEPVNSAFATSSGIDAAKTRAPAPAGSWFYTRDHWSGFGRYFASFYHKELRHDAARFYADYLPPGHYRLSYMAQAIAAGSFSALPVHAEEMYDPDVYGKGLPVMLEVSD